MKKNREDFEVFNQDINVLFIRAIVSQHDSRYLFI